MDLNCEAGISCCCKLHSPTSLSQAENISASRGSASESLLLFVSITSRNHMQNDALWMKDCFTAGNQVKTKENDTFLLQSF